MSYSSGAVAVTYYIQCKRSDSPLETVDEFPTKKEALAMIIEYRMADRTAHHYISTRCCKDWKEKK